MPRRESAWLLLVVVLLVAPIAGQGVTDKQTEAGWQALQRGEANTAATLFAEALKRRPRDASLLFGAGAAAHLLGRDDDAADILKRALTFDPILTGAAEL